MVNAVGTLNVCRLARIVQAKHLIVISSLFASYTLGDPYFNIYALSKRHADELAQFYCHKHDLPLTILRPSQIYDAKSQCRKHQSLLYLIIDKTQKGEDIIFYGNNDALRNYILLDDFCEIIYRVTQRHITGMYHCAATQSIRLSEIAKTAYRIFNQHGSISFLKDKQDISDLPIIADNELYKKIGFECTSLYQGIEKIKQNRLNT